MKKTLRVSFPQAIQTLISFISISLKYEVPLTASMAVFHCTANKAYSFCGSRGMTVMEISIREAPSPLISQPAWHDNLYFDSTSLWPYLHIRRLRPTKDPVDKVLTFVFAIELSLGRTDFGNTQLVCRWHIPAALQSSQPAINRCRNTRTLIFFVYNGAWSARIMVAWPNVVP